MDDSDLWDDFADNGTSGDGEWIKLRAPGDTVVGTVTRVFTEGNQFHDPTKVRPGDINGTPGNRVNDMCLSILKDDGNEVTMRVTSNIDMDRKMYEAKPRVGDRIAIQMEQPTRTSGGFTMNTYKVEVQRGEAPAPDAAPAAVEPQPVAPTPTASLL